jgi:hypothetical protein
LFITNESYYLNGLQYAGALGGKIISNSDPNSPPSDSLSEAVFVHQRPCYDGGPEFGFYRNIQTPSDFPNTIYFYYSDITNCTGHAFGYQNNYPNGTVVNPPQSSCYDPSTATFISNILPSQGGGKGVQIAAPTGQNSIGHYDWLYQAYVTGPSQFTVVVSDPYNSIQQSSVIVTVDPFFESYTSQMWNNGQGSQFWGYVTVAMNKKLDRDQNSNNRGDLTLNPFDFPAVGLTSLAVRQ